MSGGTFDYKQHHIRDIYETIQNDIDRNGKLKKNSKKKVGGPLNGMKSTLKIYIIKNMKMK